MKLLYSILVGALVLTTAACSKEDAPTNNGISTEQAGSTSIRVPVDLSIPFEDLKMEEGLRGVFAYDVSEDENGKIQAKLSVEEGTELKVWATLKNSVPSEPSLSFETIWKVKIDSEGRKYLMYKGDVNMTVEGGTFSTTSNPNSWKLFAYIGSRDINASVSDPTTSDRGFDPATSNNKSAIRDILSSPKQAIVGAYALHWLPMTIDKGYFVPATKPVTQKFEPQGNLLLIKVKNATQKTLLLPAKYFSISSNVLIFQPKSNYKTLGIDETLTWTSSSSSGAKASSRLALPATSTNNALAPEEESKWMAIWVATRKDVLTSQSSDLTTMASARDFVETMPKTVITALPQVEGAKAGGIVVSGGDSFNNLPRGFYNKRHRTTKDFRGNGKIHQMTITLTPETNLDGILPASWFSALYNTSTRIDWEFYKNNAVGENDETMTTYTNVDVNKGYSKYTSYTSFMALPSDGAITLGALGEEYRKPTIYELALLFPPLIGGTDTDVTGAESAVQFNATYDRTNARELVSPFGEDPIAFGATYRGNGKNIVYALRMQGGEGLDKPNKYLSAYRYEFVSTGNVYVVARYLGPQRSTTTIDDISNENYWKAELAPDQDRCVYRTTTPSPYLAVGNRSTGGTEEVYYGYAGLTTAGAHEVAPVRIPNAIYSDPRLKVVPSTSTGSSRYQVTTIPILKK